jgi:hypothetical protein
MGVNGLWKALEAQGVLRCKSGSDAGEYGAICRELEQLGTLAVDTSAWLMQVRRRVEGPCWEANAAGSVLRAEELLPDRRRP